MPASLHCYARPQLSRSARFAKSVSNCTPSYSCLPLPACPALTHHTTCCTVAFPQVLVGDQPIPFDSYCKYADTNTDELPLYL